MALGITCFLLSWWVTHIECYPFTTMKTFSNPNHRPGVVTYVRAGAHYQNGDSARADFDQWIGAMADSRYRMVIETHSAHLWTVRFATSSWRRPCERPTAR